MVWQACTSIRRHTHDSFLQHRVNEDAHRRYPRSSPGCSRREQILSIFERNGFGYMIYASFRTPFVSGEFACLMIGGYRKETDETISAF